MVKKLLFVDVDGTLTETLSGGPFKQSPDDIKPIEGAQRAIAHYASLGFEIFGISNQGGCDTINKSTGKPLKTVESAIALKTATAPTMPASRSYGQRIGGFGIPSSRGTRGDFCVLKIINLDTPHG